jgi:hypothetical protein
LWCKKYTMEPIHCTSIKRHGHVKEVLEGFIKII